jgi:hypothetical protein
MLFWAFTGSLALLALALDRDIENLKKELPKEISSQVLDPKTGKELPWSISRPEILFRQRSDDRT